MVVQDDGSTGPDDLAEEVEIDEDLVEPVAAVDERRVGDHRFADRECGAAVGQANLDDGLDTLGDQQVAEGVAVALGDRDHVEVVGAATAPRRTVLCESTAYRSHSPQASLCADDLRFSFEPGEGTGP